MIFVFTKSFKCGIMYIENTILFSYIFTGIYVQSHEFEVLELC